MKSIFNKEKWLPLVYTPIKISHLCCNKIKKDPIHAYQREHKSVPLLGTLAVESRLRTQGWIKTVCNLFKGSKSKSMPMSFWTDQDILQYIVKYDVRIPEIYGTVVAHENGFDYEVNEWNLEGGKLTVTGYERTGCMFCGFGFHSERGETRFQKLKRTHPKQYDYCMRGGAMGTQSRLCAGRT